TVVIGIIGNDFDIDGNLDLSSISIVSDPTQGEFTLNNTTGEITYIPNANACGVDSLVYSICDDGTPLPAACDLATVYIQIIDTINPVIISTLSDTLRACEGVAFSWDEPIALDNCTLTSFTCSATNNSYFEVGTTEVNYTAIDAVGNTTIMSFIIIVSTKPEVFIEKSTYEFCNGTDVTIFSQVSDSSLQFNWEFNNAMISTDREIVINNISAYNVGVYTLTVQDEFGCKATDNAFLQVVNCDILIPEGVSPNSDGKNDVFFIENLEGYPNTEVTFFNRWGMQIYQSDDYKNDWDCHSTSRLNMNNEVLPEGTYYYLIKLGGDPENLSYGKIYKGYFYIKP
ncbi:MAG: gliding motility-associated C-terminal domain-containing protein, partial [Fluviicola sp.]|nr:gliding motility-associated C-terminal domain-containing protein [Fluviicola sp.]